MLPIKPDQTVRVETSFRADDYEILARVATARKTSVAALLRRLVYDHVQPMQMAQLEREKRAVTEARERRALAEWNAAGKLSSDYDPAAPERYAPWLEE